MGTKSVRAKNKNVVVSSYSDEESLFKPSGVLDRKNARASNWGKGDLAFLRATCGFPKGTEICLPFLGERADWYAKGWVCFYYYPFKIGYKFLVTALVRGVLSVMNISTAQLMPQAWRILRTLDHIAKKLGTQFLAEDLAYTYKIKSYGKGKYNLLVKNDRLSLLGEEVANDRGWMEKYFFVKSADLGPDVDFLVEKCLPKGASLDTVGVAAQARQKSLLILETPVGDRTFTSQLFDDNEAVKASEDEAAGSEQMATSIVLSCWDCEGTGRFSRVLKVPTSEDLLAMRLKGMGASSRVRVPVVKPTEEKLFVEMSSGTKEMSLSKLDIKSVWTQEKVCCGVS